MLLVTSINKDFSSKHFLNVINEFKINKVIIIKESHQKLANFVECDAKMDDFDNNLKSEIKNLKLSLEIIKSFNLDYSYFELDPYSRNLSIVSFLSKLVVSYENKSIIDLNYFNKKYVAFLTQLANFLPSKIQFTFISDSITNDIIKILPNYVNIDPDRESNILKEILSIFSYETQYFSFLHNNIEHPSNLILNEINDILAERNISRSYPYIQACLNNLSQGKPGRLPLLNKRQNTEKRRELVFSLTEFGLFVLYLWYLNESESKSREQTESYLFKKLDIVFKNIQFNEVEYEFHSQKSTCVLCNKSSSIKLLMCTLCGLESCKSCLNIHYLANKCQNISSESESLV